MVAHTNINKYRVADIQHYLKGPKFKYDILLTF